MIDILKNNASNTLLIPLTKIRWQCRRGMRELDELLIKYFDCHYQQSSVKEQKAFRELLEYNDPELVEFLLTSHVSELKPINNIIKKIKYKL